MYKTERQLTTKQNKVIYEEVYFEKDFDIDRYNDNSGFLLTYPNKFSQNPSQDKSIGIRRIDVDPGSHFIYTGIEYNDGQNTYLTPLYRGEYQSTNTFQEILVDLQTNLQYNQNNVLCWLNAEYNPETGELLFVANMSVNGQNAQAVDFRFVCNTYQHYLQLHGLLNQRENIPFEKYLQDNNFNTNSLIFVPEYRFSNVWNRTPLYLHASFSDSKMHYACKTGDYWEKPAKIFFDNTHGLQFYIYFTTDGYHKIIPCWSNILLELSFILRTQEL